MSCLLCYICLYSLCFAKFWTTFIILKHSNKNNHHHDSTISFDKLEQNDSEMCLFGKGHRTERKSLLQDSLQCFFYRSYSLDVNFIQNENVFKMFRYYFWGNYVSINIRNQTEVELNLIHWDLIHFFWFSVCFPEYKTE